MEEIGREVEAAVCHRHEGRIDVCACRLVGFLEGQSDWEDA